MTIIFKDEKKIRTKLRRGTKPRSAKWIRHHCGHDIRGAAVGHVLKPVAWIKNKKPYGPIEFAVYDIGEVIKNFDEIMRVSKLLKKLGRYTCPEHWKQKD